MPEMPSVETLTEGELAGFSIKQEEAFWLCNTRLEEVTRDKI